MRCPYDDDAVCDIVAWGAGAIGGIQIVGVILVLWTMRGVSGSSERVPPWRLWAWTAQRIGRCPAALVLGLALPVVWACAQPESSFAVPARSTIARNWAIWRVDCFCCAIVCVSCVGNIFRVVDDRASTAGLVAGLFADALACLLVAAWATASNRGRVHAWLGKLGMRQSANAAAVVASIVGGISSREALRRAHQSFAAIPFGSLTLSDFGGTTLVDDDQNQSQRKSLSSRTSVMRLGEVDAFLSHSWHDPVDARWAMLSSWAAAFEQKHGRTPTLWFDKACIDQANINESLACLPVYLSGCQSLLVLAGPTYTRRLWCVIEVFTFLFMGGDASRIKILPIAAAHVPDEPAATAPGRSLGDDAHSDSAGSSSEFDVERQTVIDAFASFDARNCSCFIEEDRQRLLGVIESGFGSMAAFNESVRSIFPARLRRLSSTHSASELHSGSPRLHGLGGKLGGTSKWSNLGVALKWSAAANKPSSDVSSESRRNRKGAGGYSRAMFD